MLTSRGSEWEDPPPPSPFAAPAADEHLVFVSMPLPAERAAALAKLAPRNVELRVGPQELTLTLRGADADALWAASELVLQRQSIAAAGHVLRRYGGAGARESVSSFSGPHAV